MWGAGRVRNYLPQTDGAWEERVIHEIPAWFDVWGARGGGCGVTYRRAMVQGSRGLFTKSIVRCVGYGHSPMCWVLGGYGVAYRREMVQGRRRRRWSPVLRPSVRCVVPPISPFRPEIQS